MKRSMMVVGMCSLLAACGSEGGNGQVSGTLKVDQTAAGVSGSYRLGETSLTFNSRQVDADVFDVVVNVHGMTLAAVVDRNQQLAEVDGFAKSGSDTQIVDADRALLGDFTRALAGKVDTEQSAAAATLYRVSSNWSQTPDTVPLQRQVAGSENHGWTSICAYYNYYVDATHDDNNYSAFSPYTTSHAHVGYRSSSTYYYIGYWTTATQNHQPLLYEYGNCYGNCGGGCPGGNQTLTLDCHDHDQCVRNGHALASLWCDDEFVSASDDEFFAPRCSGT